MKFGGRSFFLSFSFSLSLSLSLSLSDTSVVCVSVSVCLCVHLHHLHLVHLFLSFVICNAGVYFHGVENDAGGRRKERENGKHSIGSRDEERCSVEMQ